jgi:hypothetical protein
MKNKIFNVSSKEIIYLKQEIKKSGALFIGEIDGKLIKQKQDFLDSMSKIFMFPYPASGFDGYFDWIRDLDWLQKEGYILIIYNFKEFLNMDMRLKNQIIDDFKNIILPWWESEVEKFVVRGKPKLFNIYLVNE